MDQIASIKSSITGDQNYLDYLDWMIEKMDELINQDIAVGDMVQTERWRHRKDRYLKAVDRTKDRLKQWEKLLNKAIEQNAQSNPI